MKNRRIVDQYPDKNGHYGPYGGKFAPETLMSALKELEIVYEQSLKSREFKEELEYFSREYIGRPTPLYYAENISCLKLLLSEF